MIFIQIISNNRLFQLISQPILQIMIWVTIKPQNILLPFPTPLRKLKHFVVTHSVQPTQHTHIHQLTTRQIHHWWRHPTHTQLPQQNLKKWVLFLQPTHLYLPTRLQIERLLWFALGKQFHEILNKSSLMDCSAGHFISWR